MAVKDKLVNLEDLKVVGDVVGDLNSALTTLEVPLIEGIYLNTSGEQTSLSAFSGTDFIPFAVGDKFALISFNNSRWAYCLGYAFYDENKNYIANSGGNNFDGNFTSASVTIPENAAYVRFSTRTSESPNALVFVNYTNGADNEISRKYATTIDRSDIVNSSCNLFNKDAIITGKEVYGDGSIADNSGSAITGFIDIEFNRGTLFLTGIPQYETSFASKFFAFYDSEKQIISHASINTDITEFSLPVPNNAKYFIMSVYQRATNPQNVDYSSFAVSFTGMPNQLFINAFGGVDGTPVKNAIMPTYGKSLLIFGDSITETATVSNDGTEYTENTRQNWPTFAKNIMQVSDMYNFAKTGAAYADRADVEERQKISVQISSAISSGRTGDIIVISAGTNDSTNNVGSYESAMAKATLADLDRTVLYEAIRWAMWTIRANYKNSVCFAATPIQRADREPSKVVRDAIIQMAQRYNFIIIDAETESGIVRENQVESGSGNDLYDGLHPNKTGQCKMAQLYSSVIINNFVGS